MRITRLAAPLVAAVSIFFAGSASAASVDQSLMKLGPEERARQACAIKGIEQLRREKRLARPDFVSPAISKPAVFDGSVVTATGGAVRANHRWYALSFTCSVSKDLTKATSFAYTLGPEIPKTQWADLGLWE